MIPMDQLDLARGRWARKHRELGLPAPSDDEVPEPRGLARKVEEIGSRIEDAWGIKASCILDRTREHEGRFHPRSLDL